MANDIHPPPEPDPDKRQIPRATGNAQAIVYRDSDVMRLGLKGILKDISPTGLGIVIPESLNVNEHIKLALINEIQRINIDTRGVVRHVSSDDNGQFQVGVELFTRLAPLDLSLLKMGIKSEGNNPESTWF
jgi:hypothetical protein